MEFLKQKVGEWTDSEGVVHHADSPRGGEGEGKEGESKGIEDGVRSLDGGGGGYDVTLRQDMDLILAALVEFKRCV